ncbi:hypothetical protein GOBAR_AA32753 [Gossypium barbadense]|uniref:Uncharacterized protein n=1 Tax=Gossypium barbadense TaxID=3634 RepID=A0A2P5WA68_GOSBA|nr:hypothetical protein GOBAR_AA32753 [Gossypium barbadense]
MTKNRQVKSTNHVYHTQMRQGKTTQMNNSMPNAVKFLKELLTNEQKLDKALHVELNVETRSKNTLESCSNNNKGPIYEEQRLQIEELDEWWTHKPRTHNKPKPRHEELNISPNQLKVGAKVLLDAADPRIATSEPNEAIPLTVLSIFPYGTVEVIHPKFGTFKSLNTRFPEPYGQAQGCAVGRTRTTGGKTALRYGCVKIEKKYFPNTGSDKLPRPCDMAVGNPTKLTWACGTTVVEPVKTTRASAYIHSCERSEQRMTRPCNMAVFTSAPNFESHETYWLTRPCAPISL